MDIEDMLRELARDGRRDSRGREERYRTTPPDVLCITLKETAERYGKGCTFKVGDLVTPRKGYNLKGEGEPNVVLEVRPNAVADTRSISEPSDHTSQAFGCRLDMRVGHEVAESMIAHWVESWQFEPYTGPGAED